MAEADGPYHAHAHDHAHSNSNSDNDNDHDYDFSPKGLVLRTLSSAKRTSLLPFRAATSPTARRAYVTSILLSISSVLLLGLGLLAYVVFYWSYVPATGLSREVFLQFDQFDGGSSSSGSGGGVGGVFGGAGQHHPWGLVKLGSDSSVLASRQKYDVSLHLRMPRTEANLDAGNFMLSLTLFSSAPAALTPASVAKATVAGGEVEREVLAKSSRPAILKYRSWLVESAGKVLRLPLYVLLGWREEEWIHVRMMEGVVFERGWRNLPASVKVEVRSRNGREQVQVYECYVGFSARLGGLRHIMYNYRLLSLLTFTTLFWLSSMTALLTTWTVLSFFSQGSSLTTTTKSSQQKRQQLQADHTTATTTNNDESNLATPTSPSHPSRKIKVEGEMDEDEDASASPSEDIETPASLSDTSRSFPTFSTQRPLKYSASSSSKSKVKKEDEDNDDNNKLDFSRIPPAIAAEGDGDGDGDGVREGEAADVEDMEDEDADFVIHDSIGLDSGLGTSLESSGGGAHSVRGRGAKSSSSSGSVRRRRSGGGGGGGGEGE